jgi:hypothetical protein
VKATTSPLLHKGRVERLLVKVLQIRNPFSSRFYLPRSLVFLGEGVKKPKIPQKNIGNVHGHVTFLVFDPPAHHTAVSSAFLFLATQADWD